MITIAYVVFILSAIPALLWISNMMLFRPPGKNEEESEKAEPLPPISVLIPARNEEDRLAPLLDSLLSSRDVDLEVIVYDDQSTDGTVGLVRDYENRDDRVRLIEGEDLPEDWVGKQYACWQLSREARHEIFCFIDADVRLDPRALVRFATELQQSKSVLISGFPGMETQSFAERLFLPFIRYLLLGFLPFWGMKYTNHPAFSAGCGQMMMAEKQPYRDVGGHRAIRNSRHDGITLPTAFRSQGYHTTFFDAQELAQVRMYEGLISTWEGLAKNATEGMARPGALPIFTILLLGGQVLPVPLLVGVLLSGGSGSVLAVLLASVILSYYPRVSGAIRFDQSFWSAFCHPLGVLLLLVNQYGAFFHWLAGGEATWRGRAYKAR